VETEVSICTGWVADIAAILDPTITELLRMKLINHQPKHTDEVGYRQWREAAKHVQRLMTVLVEVKTSRSDFRRDIKWSIPIPADIAYLAIPKELEVRFEEIPEPWGVLKYSGFTDGARLARPPTPQKTTVEQQLEIAVQIAIRRDHHTRYARLREFRRGLVIARNAEISRDRGLAAMRAMISIVQAEHGSIEATLEWHGIKHLPAFVMSELRRLWGRAPKTETD
jgi:hypothetical protein